MEKMVKVNFKEVFQQKKVFVTGHTGFKGSWLICWLQDLGANIKGYALATESDNDLYDLINGDSICESVIADIRDKEKLRSEIISFQPDFIFHLAAQPIVRYSYDFPVETFEVNTLGTANVLDALRFLEKSCVAVVITTDKVYENHETGEPYVEKDKLGGYDPYSASKAAAEIIVSSYRNSFFSSHQFSVHKKSISSARAGNVIGGGDWAKDRIIPDIVRALSNDKPIQIRNPDSIRPWQHVLDSLSGYLSLAAHQFNDPVKYAQAFNFGPQMNDCKKVKDIVESAMKCWGRGSADYKKNAQDYHEAALLRLDISKAGKILNWSPKYDSDIAILKTISWYKEFIDSGKQHAKDLLINDIIEYNEL